GLLVRLELLQLCRSQRRRRLLEGHLSRALRSTAGEGGPARLRDLSRGLELAIAANVHIAPMARRLSRREAVHVARGVDGPDDTVDPSKAEGLVERLLVGDARL